MIKEIIYLEAEVNKAKNKLANSSFIEHVRTNVTVHEEISNAHQYKFGRTE